MKNKKIVKYLSALAMMVAMMALAEFTGETEIIFPEIAALTIGLWISNKHIWQVTDVQLVSLMTLAAIVGVLIVRYSPLPLVINITIAFVVAGVILTSQRSTLYPLVSALILPVLLHTTSWVYPLSVLAMTVVLVVVKKIFEAKGIRNKTDYTPSDHPIKSAIVVWAAMTCSLLSIAAIGYCSTYIYIIS